MTAETRKPTLAALLSLIVPGLGHIYLGRIVPGLELMVGHVVLGSLATLLVVARLTSLGAVWGAAAPWVVLWIGASVWAYRCASTEPSATGTSEVQRVHVYVLIGLLALPNAAAWALAIREYVAELFVIPSGSMLPSITPGSRVLVNKLVYEKEPLRRGDMVVFTNPNARDRKYIKRVVALPGDIVAMQNDELVINGKPLEYQDAARSASGGTTRIENNGGARYSILLSALDSTKPSGVSKPSGASFPPQTVPNGHCFVLGDRRHRTDDSRTHGPVPLTDVVGRVDRVF